MRGWPPLLSKHCLECHNRSDAKGGLDLSRRDAATAGGENGLAFVSRKPDASLLWQSVEADIMPQDRPPLSDAEKATLRQWIADGAAWGTARIDPFLTSTDRRAGYDWWSLQPIAQPAPPAVTQTAWPINGIDNFVLARLESAGLAPSPAADRRTLVRRVAFDLTGLPPTPEEVAAFLADDQPQAYERLVDRLLESPRYGERWGRHWLDVVRFGESQGYERNRIRDNAWRYRDWVIGAFNADLPLNEFIRRQIAGDVLYPGDADAAVATGYHVAGTWDQVAHNEGSEPMRKAARQDHLEDLVATLGQSFFGADGAVRPLPRSQVRPDCPGRLLPHRRAAGGDSSTRRRTKECRRSGCGTCSNSEATAADVLAGPRRLPQPHRSGRSGGHCRRRRAEPRFRSRSRRSRSRTP